MNDAQKIYMEAIGALNRAQWRQAQDLAAQLLRMVPNHADAYFIAGVAASRLQQMDLSIAHLQRAVALNPQRAAYWAELARGYTTGWFTREALEAADKAFALSPDDPQTWSTLGVVYSRTNVHARAAEAFEDVVKLAPDVAEFRFNLSTARTAMGDLSGAERECLECLRLNPRYWKAWLTLAQLRKQTAQDNHVPRLQQQLVGDNASDEAAMYLNLALAKEFEDMADYPQAFAHLSEGKRRGGLGRRYTIERDRQMFEALMQTPMTPLDEAIGEPSIAPIFVIGMPRSGTTLVERILSSHPQVHSAGELQNFPVAVKRASGSITGPLLDMDTVRRAGKADWGQMGGQYQQSTRLLTGGKPRFVDKLPHNFLYAGHIARALPNASIVCLRRDPMDTCLSNFRQLFAQTSPYYDYSFDLLNTGHYYMLFDQLMAHWQQTMPGRILQINYEDLVENQETVTRRLLAHCRLDWNDACLRFEENESPVSTASAVQVRSPMFRSSLQRWKRYEPHLRELRELLESSGIRVE
jgi:tetratricopeptide (TPR) repeat protein